MFLPLKIAVLRRLYADYIKGVCVCVCTHIHCAHINCYVAAASCIEGFAQLGIWMCVCLYFYNTVLLTAITVTLQCPS
jgi:hypothetical protein